MIDVNLHFDVHGWAYHGRCVALAKYAPTDFAVHVGGGRGTNQASRCQLAMQLCYTHVRELRKSYRQAGANPVMVAGLNVGWTETNARHLQQALEDADHVVINSRDVWERAGHPAKSTWISNGVDRGLYRTIVPPAHRPPRVLWCGSAYHRRLKGFDDYVIPICRRLWRERGIEMDARLVDSHGGPSRWNSERMRDWYQTGTVYLCASETEGTPNPALEAASAGCVICSTPVGNMPELIENGVNGRLVDRDLESLYAGVVECLDRYAQMQPAMEQAIAGWDWQIRAGQYWDLFRHLCE